MQHQLFEKMNIDQLKTFAIILNYNSADESVALFKNLVEQQYKYLKILVIDNASKEEDQNQLKENIPSENLIFSLKNLGYAGGNNIGIEIALNGKADYVWILNPDIRVNNHTLPILLKTITEDKTLAAVGPRILQRERPNLIFTDGEQLIFDKQCYTIHKNSFKEADKTPEVVDYNIDYIDGSCILLNSNAIKELGMLPKEYFLYFEETDWCFNAKKHNWKLAVNSKAVVYNLTSVKKELFHYYFLRNKLIFSKKFHPEFKSVRRYYARLLMQEFFNRFTGKYLRPYFKSRLKGLLAGIIRTV